ncbi:MAG: glycosyltransferase [Acidobacteriota bacterium]
MNTLSENEMNLSDELVAACVATKTPLAVMQVVWSLVAGGSEMYAYTVAANLNAERFSSSLCAIDKGGALEPEIRRKAIPYFVMNRRNGLDFALMWRMYRLLKSQRIRVIHTHHFNQLFYSVIGAKLTGARIVHMEHSIEYLKSKKFRLALKFLSFFCDKVMAIGNDGLTVLKEQVGIHPRKLEIVRAGVDPAIYAEEKKQARQALGLNADAKIIAIIARLFPEKNHLLLLAAFAEVVRRLSNAQLLIVGDGTEQKIIEEKINELHLTASVQMLGVRRDVPRILAAADVFALSSDREGLPIAVLEAMAAGKPVVATAVGDLPMVVKDGETGRLVPPKNSQAFADALCEILSDSDLASKMGANARRASENYSLRAMIEKFEKLYSGK